jgi:hypothetical protein
MQQQGALPCKVWRVLVVQQQGALSSRMWCMLCRMHLEGLTGVVRAMHSRLGLDDEQLSLEY